MMFSSRCQYPETNQCQTQYSNQWDECNLVELLFDDGLDLESVVSSAGLPVSSCVDYRYNCAPLQSSAVRSTTVPTCQQKPLYPSKQRRSNMASVMAKRAKQRERDNCKQKSDEKAFWNFLQMFDPHSKLDHSSTEITKAEKADYMKYLSQCLLETYEGWPQEKRKLVDEFIQRVSAMYNKLQLEPEMRRRKSKTCKQRWASNMSMYCKHCSVPSKKKACLMKGKTMM